MAIKRVYYLYGTPEDVERGFHAHKELEQVLIAVSGSCEVLLDDGAQQKIVELDSPAKGLYIGPSVWRVMRNFSADSVLLVLASDHYYESDYIRDYNEFKRWMK